MLEKKGKIIMRNVEQCRRIGGLLGIDQCWRIGGYLDWAGGNELVF